MSTLRGEEYGALEERILKATEEGAVTLWTERIAQLAKRAGLDLSYFNWSGSPRQVAFDVINVAQTYGWLDKLTALLE